jgi:hypothetical protein
MALHLSVPLLGSQRSALLTGGKIDAGSKITPVLRPPRNAAEMNVTLVR